MLGNNYAKKEQRIDVLNRQPIVNRVVEIINLLAQSKNNTCFALNGRWGVGKSFVLDMIEEQLQDIQSEENATNRYLLFHYNCWQYDYYEEPLVAMVSSMIDTIDEKENIISNDIKAKVKGVLKIAGTGLLNKAGDMIKEKTGVDSKAIIDILTECTDEMAEKVEEEHSFDANFIFKKTLIKIQETITELSEQKTLIFIVDELDRCLPEYQIKILERLHHIFNDIPNAQVILSVDKLQLEHTVETIFGKGTNTEKYLSKFIKFEIKLDNGDFGNEFDQKFAFYLNQFELNDMINSKQIEKYINDIFYNLEIRERIEIIEKAHLIHNILKKDETKLDYWYMCVEIFLCVLKKTGVEEHWLKENFNYKEVFPAKIFKDKCPGLLLLNSVYSNSPETYFQSKGLKNLIKTNDIWGIILGAYRVSIGYKNDLNFHTENEIEIDYIKKYSDDFWQLLKIIN